MSNFNSLQQAVSNARPLNKKHYITAEAQVQRGEMMKQKKSASKKRPANRLKAG